MILIDGAKVYADVLGVMLGNHLLYGLKEPRLEIDRMILRAIRNVEPVDAVPVRHGKWIYGNDFHWYTASCNKCGYQRKTDIKAEGWNQWKFCPNCGADMRGEQDERLNQQTGGD